MVFIKNEVKIKNFLIESGVCACYNQRILITDLKLAFFVILVTFTECLLFLKSKGFVNISLKSIKIQPDLVFDIWHINNNNLRFWAGICE